MRSAPAPSSLLPPSPCAPSPVAAAAVLSLFALAAGCRSTPPAAELHEGALPARPDPGDAVAVVDGRAITAADVATQARAAGTDARRALDDLIDAELLAAEAARRGLLDDPEVREAARREMVRRHLATGFEVEVTPAAVSEPELRRAYLRHRARLDHPAVALTRHVLVPFPGATAPGPVPAPPVVDPALRDRLRRRADDVLARARALPHSAAKPRDPEVFVALAKELTDEQVRLKGELVAAARDGWVEQPYADAAWAIAEVGGLSPVVETSYGFHVILLEKRIPEERISFEDAKEKLRESLWPQLREREFKRYLDETLARHAIEIHAENLESGEPPGAPSPNAGP